MIDKKSLESEFRCFWIGGLTPTNYPLQAASRWGWQNARQLGDIGNHDRLQRAGLFAGISTGSNGLATRPDLVGNQIEGTRTVEPWFNMAAFAAPAPGFFGNAGRNIIRGPGTHKWDMSFFKNNRLNERMNLQFRAEFLNIFNHASFNGINSTFGDGAFSARDPRIIQFGLKLGF